MAEKKLRVVHYLNQFFGQIGGEEKATTGFMVKEGPVGPGLALQKELGDRAEIVATVICGDDYFAGNPEQMRGRRIEAGQTLSARPLLRRAGFRGRAVRGCLRRHV